MVEEDGDATGTREGDRIKRRRETKEVRGEREEGKMM